MLSSTRGALGALTAAATIAVAAPAGAGTLFDFSELSDGFELGSYYAAQGVTFSNAKAVAISHPAALDPFAITSISNEGLEGTFAEANAIYITFGADVGQAGIQAFGNGAAGIRIEAYDAFNVLLRAEEYTHTAGPAQGVNNTFGAHFAGGGIRSLKIYQVGDGAALGDSVTLDNLFITGGIPEPSTWAMMIVGFGLAGSALRRGRRPLEAQAQA
ncbi:PEPxxWA-CTERM sorting domain-containing protein [Phenylobacterium sp.]|uniref:PEPxxWA-CTERM sorting domain-containing protein n=1 Tax=Phenylobacterium sp. TaxID=1871053 RepID=UPI0027330D75|nr:PEPxxWA-CTERM sorting domain-containing protein [Phenylobacterium sp.]MDP3853610.1 PEPxxWA-CTERM sorting domain-containing protein [Phenylobacterium sp.]